METTIIILLCMLLAICVGIILFQNSIIKDFNLFSLEENEVTVDEMQVLLDILNKTMTQAEIGKVIGVKQPCVSALMNREITTQRTLKKHYKKLIKLV